MRNISPLQRAAVHEAAHGVMAIARGFEVHGAHVLPHGRWRGSCFISPSSAVHGFVGAELLLAGDIAVLMAQSGQVTLPYSRAGRWYFDHALAPALEVPGEQTCSTDAAQIRERRISDADVRAARESLVRDLFDRWTAVVAVGNALIERGALGGEEFTAIAKIGGVGRTAAGTSLAARSSGNATDLRRPTGTVGCTPLIFY